VSKVVGCQRCSQRKLLSAYAFSLYKRYSRKCSIAPKLNWDISTASLQLPWDAIGAYLRSFVNPKTSRLLCRNLPSCLMVASFFRTLARCCLSVVARVVWWVVEADGREVPPCYAAPPPTPSWPTGCLLFGLPGYRSQWRKNPQPRATRPGEWESMRERKREKAKARGRERLARGGFRPRAVGNRL